MRSSKSRKDLAGSLDDAKLSGHAAAAVATSSATATGSSGSGSGGGNMFSSFWGRKRRVASGSPDLTLQPSLTNQARELQQAKVGTTALPSTPASPGPRTPGLRSSLASRQYKALSRSMNDLSHFPSREETVEIRSVESSPPKRTREKLELPFAAATIIKSGWANRKTNKREAPWKLSRLYLRESKLYFFKPPADIPIRAFDVHLANRSGLSVALLGVHEEQLHPADFEGNVRDMLFDLKSTNPQRFQSCHRLQEEGIQRMAFFLNDQLVFCLQKSTARRTDSWFFDTMLEVLQCEAVVTSTGFDEMVELRVAGTTRRFKCPAPAQFVSDFEAATLCARPATAPLLATPRETLLRDGDLIVSGSVEDLCFLIMNQPEDSQAVLLLQTVGFWHPAHAVLQVLRQQAAGDVAPLITRILEYLPSILLDAGSVDGLLKLIDKCDKQKQSQLTQHLWQRRADLLSIIGMQSVVLEKDKLNLKEGLTNDILLTLNPTTLAEQLHLFHHFFFDAWNPADDLSLFFATASRNPLVFSARHMHFLTHVVLQQLLDHQVDLDRRAEFCTFWVRVASASKKAGDMTAWVAIVMAVCAPSVVRLCGMWSQIDARLRLTVEKEWGPVIRDLLRRSLGGTLEDLASAHVLAPDAGKTSAEAHEIVPFYGDLCDAVEHIRETLDTDSIAIDQIAAAHGAVSDALGNWEQFQSKRGMSTTKTRLASHQHCFMRLNAQHLEVCNVLNPFWMDASFLCEPSLAIDDLHERKQACELSIGTAAFLPLLFTDLLPTYRLFDPSDLLQFSDPSRKQAKSAGLRRLNSFPPSGTGHSYTTGHDALDETTRARHAASVSDWKMLRHLKDLTGVQENQLTASDESFVLRNAAQGPRAAKVRPQSVIMETRRRDSIVSRRSSLIVMEEDLAIRPASRKGPVRECVVKAATLDKMIDLAISDLTELKGITLKPLVGQPVELDGIGLDRLEYTKMLLASIRSYCTPLDFLKQLAGRAAGKSAGVVQVLTLWLTHCPCDFFPSAMQDALNELFAVLPEEAHLPLRKQLLRIHHTPIAWHWPETADDPFDISAELKMQDAADMLDALDTLSESVLQTTTLHDWMRFYELLEYESLDPKAFCVTPEYLAGQDLIITSCASLLFSINRTGTEEPLMSFVPAPIRFLFDLGAHVRDWVVAQVTDPAIDATLRAARIRFFLTSLAVSAARMRPFDITVSGTPDQKKTQIVPSFAASAIAAGLIRPASRAFVASWSTVSESLGNGEYCGTLMELIVRIDVQISGPPLVPCICWLTERMFEIACCLPDTLISHPSLINFDKRQYIYNLLVNLDVLGPFASTPDKRFRFLLSPVDSHDPRTVRETATRENQHRRQFRLFADIITLEQEKIRRDMKQRETVDRMLKEARRTAQRKQAEMQRTLELSRRPQASTRSRYGMNTLLRAVRPLSVAITGTWAEKPPAAKVAPGDLPEQCSIREGTKPVLTVDLVKAHVQMVNTQDFILLIRSEDGVETHVQAPTFVEAEDWVRRVLWASIDGARKRQSMIQEDRMRPFDEPQFSPRNSRVMNVSTAIFGIRLEILCQREESLLPRVAHALIDAVEERGLDEVGIYRISGSLTTVNALKQSFDTGRSVDLDDDRWADIHAIAGAFKLWLRELPEPVMTYGLYADFLATVEIADATAKLSKLKQLIQQLPKPNFILLKRLLEHLQKVTDYETTNHMYAHNLAIVFGPNVLQPVPSAMSFANSMNDLGKVQTVMRTLILQCHALFSAADEEVEEAMEGEEERGPGGSSAGNTSLTAILEK